MFCKLLTLPWIVYSSLLSVRCVFDVFVTDVAKVERMERQVRGRQQRGRFVATPFIIWEHAPFCICVLNNLFTKLSTWPLPSVVFINTPSSFPTSEQPETVNLVSTLRKEISNIPLHSFYYKKLDIRNK